MSKEAVTVVGIVGIKQKVRKIIKPTIQLGKFDKDLFVRSSCRYKSSKTTSWH